MSRATFAKNFFRKNFTRDPYQYNNDRKVYGSFSDFARNRLCVRYVAMTLVAHPIVALIWIVGSQQYLPERVFVGYNDVVDYGDVKQRLRTRLSTNTRSHTTSPLYSFRKNVSLGYRRRRLDACSTILLRHERDAIQCSSL